MNYRLIYYLEKVIGEFFCYILKFYIDQKLSFSKENVPSEKVLFIKFIEQGALVLHLHTFLLAQKKLGAQYVYFCTFESNRSFIQSLNIFKEDQVYYIDSSNLLRFIFSFLSKVFEVRKLKFKTSIDLEFLSSSTIIFSVLGGVKRRIGFIHPNQYHPRNDLVNVPVTYSEKLHVSESGYVLLSEMMDVEKERESIDMTSIKDSLRQTLPQFSTQISNDIAHLKSSLKIIIHPNFNDPLPLRSWTEDKYAHLMIELKKTYQDCDILMTGREDEFEQTQLFIEKYDLNAAVNLCGKTTWTDLLNLYQWADLLICTDSGPAHFASLFDLNTVVMFGPETPDLYAPLGNHVKVIYKNISCSPCYNVYNHRTSSCTSNICVKNISVEEVMFEVEQLLYTYKNQF